MKRSVGCLLCVLVGIAIGWHFGHTRPVHQRQRELLADYKDVKETVLDGMTDKEIADFGKELPGIKDALKRQNEVAALVALHAFTRLEHGDIDEARRALLQQIGLYWRAYRQTGDKSLLASIASAAKESPALAEELEREGSQ